MVGAKGATTTKFLKFSLPIWISAFGGFEWGARKRLRKNKGENFRGFVLHTAESPLGNWEGFQKSSLVGFSLKKIRILSKRARFANKNAESRPSGAFLCSKSPRLKSGFDLKS